MRILLITADYPPIEGGIATVARHTARELAALGHAVTVLAPHFPGMEAFDAAQAPVKIIRYRGYRLGWFRLFPMMLYAWPYVLGADVILAANVAYGGIIGLLARVFIRKRYAAFAYAYEFLRFRRVPFAADLLRAVYRRADFTVAISSYTRDKLIEFGAPEDRVRVILPGAPTPKDIRTEQLDEVRRKFVLEGGPIILTVGRFVPRKGHETLVRAFPRVLQRYPGAVLVLAGRGPAMPFVTRAAARLGIRDRVRLPGHVPDDELAALYQLCDVFALPTGEGPGGQVEGFGLVFVEAQTYGKPVVAGRSGGVPDAVLDGETGLLVPPDDPEALAAALLRLLDAPPFAQRLAQAAQHRAQTELAWSRFAGTLVETFEKSPTS